VHAGAVLRLQDADLGGEPLGRQVGQRAAHRLEEAAHGRRPAGGVEGGEVELDDRVALQVRLGQRAQDEVLDQVGRPDGREGLVPQADAEHEGGGDPLRARCAVHRHAADLDALHRAMLRCPRGRPGRHARAAAGAGRLWPVGSGRALR
jgi:hypothetical protein